MQADDKAKTLQGLDFAERTPPTEFPGTLFYFRRPPAILWPTDTGGVTIPGPVEWNIIAGSFGYGSKAYLVWIPTSDPLMASKAAAMMEKWKATGTPL